MLDWMRDWMLPYHRYVKPFLSLLLAGQPSSSRSKERISTLPLVDPIERLKVHNESWSFPSTVSSLYFLYQAWRLFNKYLWFSNSRKGWSSYRVTKLLSLVVEDLSRRPEIEFAYPNRLSIYLTNRLLGWRDKKVLGHLVMRQHGSFFSCVC